MARFAFKLPDIGEGIAEAEITAWYVKVGDMIAEDAPIADLMTDKATVAMESPVSGVVTALAGVEGDQIAIGATLVVIETDDVLPDHELPDHEDAPADHYPAADQGGGGGLINQDDTAHKNSSSNSPAISYGAISKGTGGAGISEESSPPEDSHDHNIPSAILASPAVRARARELGIALADVKPMGGHIRHADLDNYLRYGAGQGYRPPVGVGRPALPRQDETVKVIGLRRRIAENMSASKRSIPHFSYVEEINVTALEDMRAALNAAHAQATPAVRPKLSLLPFFIVAICRAIPDFPMINARYDDQAGFVTRYGAVHIGMATQTSAGLLVPVIRDAQNLTIWQIAREIARLADTTRGGQATREELSGSTLTLSSLGVLGGIAATPVINRPEVAIIAPNRIIERPIFDGDDIIRAKMMNLSISCDHRVVDGMDAAQFVQCLKTLLETPVLLFAD